MCVTSDAFAAVAFKALCVAFSAACVFAAALFVTIESRNALSSASHLFACAGSGTKFSTWCFSSPVFASTCAFTEFTAFLSATASVSSCASVSSAKFAASRTESPPAAADTEASSLAYDAAAAVDAAVEGGACGATFGVTSAAAGDDGDGPFPGENECASPRNIPAHKMKHKMKVTLHHHTRCCSFAGHTPIQVFDDPTPWPYSSYSDSEDDPSNGARAGCSAWYLKIVPSPTFLGDLRWCFVPPSGGEGCKSLSAPCKSLSAPSLTRPRSSRSRRPRLLLSRSRRRGGPWLSRDEIFDPGVA